MSHAISWDCPSCKRPGKLVPASMGDPAFWICANTNCGNMNAVREDAPKPYGLHDGPTNRLPARREDAAGARDDAHCVAQWFEDSWTGSTDEPVYQAAMRLLAALSTAEREREAAIASLREVHEELYGNASVSLEFALHDLTSKQHHTEKTVGLVREAQESVNLACRALARVPSGGET